MNIILVLLLYLKTQLKLSHSLNENEEDKGHEMVQRKQYTLCSNKNFPFVVSVVISRDIHTLEKKNVLVCLGTLVQNKWVMTAASCISDQMYTGEREFKVKTISSNDPVGVGVTKHYIHPQYLRGILKDVSPYDVAMVHLTHPMGGAHQAYVRFPHQFRRSARNTGLNYPRDPYGFNKEETNKWSYCDDPTFLQLDRQGQLQCTKISIRPVKECLSKLKLFRRRMDPNLMCTEAFDTSSTCRHDKGGPLLCHSQYQVGMNVRAACVQRGRKSGEEEAGVRLFVKMRTIIDFVEDVIEKEERLSSRKDNTTVDMNGLVSTNIISYTIILLSILSYLVM